MSFLVVFLARFAFSYPVGHDCQQKNRLYDCGLELICANGTCMECVNNEDCEDVRYYCRRSSKEPIDVCRFEPLTHKWSWRLWVGFILLFIAGIFVSGAGIGGGGLFVPIMMLVIGFPAEYSISSSNPIIFGGSIAVSAFNLNKRHPDYDRPLINYNVAGIIEPISWLGTIIGVIINAVIPDWLLYLIQFFLLAYTAYTTFKKGYAEWRKRKAQQETELSNIGNKGSIKNALNPGSADVPGNLVEPFADPNSSPAQVESETKDEPLADSTSLTNDVAQPGLVNYMQDSSSTPIQNIEPAAFEFKSGKPAYSRKTLVILGIFWAIFCALPFFRGGKATNSIVGIKVCSTVYWIVTFLPFPVYIVISAYMIKLAQNYPVIGPNADLNAKQIAYLISFGVIAGVASGFLGIGGGMIKGPMLLALGIEAEEMAATSSFLLLLTSSITSIQFVARGTLPYSEFAIYVATGFVSFLVGVNLLKVLITKTNNRSIVLYVLGSAIALSAILMSYAGIVDVVRGIKQGASIGFRRYCQSEE